MTSGPLVCWFSAGAASAVAAKLALRDHPDADVVRVHVAEEGEDNPRFAADCETWLGKPIRTMRSTEYDSAEDVWTRRRYMSGPKGAVCTVEMKKAVRWAYERERNPAAQVFGFTVEERSRAQRFIENNPDIRCVFPLIDQRLTKDDCFAIIQRAGLLLPLSYRQGYRNANCIGCVAAQSPSYWNRVRRTHPEVFERRAVLSRELGVRLVKLTSGTRERIFLDELQATDFGDDEGPTWDCTIACAVAEHRIAETTP